jgi:hypothetical protein
MEVDRHIAAAVSGLSADARTLVDHARVHEPQFMYNHPIKLESLRRLCDLFDLGSVWGVRVLVRRADCSTHCSILRSMYWVYAGLQSNKTSR